MSNGLFKRIYKIKKINMKNFSKIALVLILVVSGYFKSKACTGLNTPILTSSLIIGPVGSNSLLLNMNSVTIWIGCTGYRVEVELTCNGQPFTGNGPFFYTSPPFNKTSNPQALPQMTLNLSSLCQGGVYSFRWRETWNNGSPSPWSAGVTFTLPGVPAPASVSITATPTAVCFPQPSQLTSTVSGGTVTAWSWVQNSDTSGIKQIKLVIKTDLGCSSDTLIKPIKIYSRPQVDFTFTDSVCLGTATQFTGIITSADPVLYWNYSVDEGGIPVLSGTNASYTFTIPGAHQVLFFASTIGNTGCSGSIQKMVFVVDKPRAALKQFAGCQSATVQLFDSSYTTDGLVISNWWWDLGNGQFSSLQNPGTLYNTAGIKNIKLVVWNNKGCQSDTLYSTINIAALPVAGFITGSSSCSNTNISFTDTSIVAGGTVVAWSWMQNSGVFSTAQNPTASFPQGTNTIELVVTSNANCISLPATGTFVVKTIPQISMQFKDTCKWSPAYFTAAESGTNIGITEWYWNFGDGSALATGNPMLHTYTANGAYPVKLYAMSTEGCKTATVQRNINIYGTDAFAGNDTIAAPSQPIRLQASGGLSYEWSPSSGLSNTNIANPVAINTIDKIYYLRAFTPSGCESRDTINIKIYKGPDIYMPNAFTPNEDGRNDILRGKLIGLKSFDYFVIYNRYGQLIFSTTNPDEGWNGRYKFLDQPAGAYIWMASGTTFTGKKIMKKGTVLLLR